MDQEIAAVSAAWLYMLAGCALFAAGVVALFRDRHLLRQVIALNVIGGGVFLVMIASAAWSACAWRPPSPACCRTAPSPETPGTRRTGTG